MSSSDYQSTWPYRFDTIEPFIVALFAGIAGVAASYAIAGFTPAFIAGPIAGFMARRLPAEVITFSIVVLGALGHQIGILLSLGTAIILLGFIALIGRLVSRHFHRPIVGFGSTVIGASLVTLGITGAPVASLGTGVATGAIVFVPPLRTRYLQQKRVSPARRCVITSAIGTVSFIIGGYILGSQQSPQSFQSQSSQSQGFQLSEPIKADIDTKLAEAEQKSLVVDGLEPLVSTDFYQVDINATDPTVDASTWTLTVTGDVDRELTYSYNDILNRPPENRFISLRCVGESLNGKKMDNALWTGIPLMDLIEPAGIGPQCCVMLRAADEFYEEFPVSALRTGFLAYGMNGEELPRAHGYPVRALIPGHWGEINLKWLTEIEILEEEQDGYWEQRGWHGTGPVNTVAKLHVTNRLSNDQIEVAGHAYAGTRGIQLVEVSTDGGATWTEASLSDELPGEDVWRQWVHRYESPGERHEVTVRATDGEGTLQPEAEASPFPNGPSGWVSMTIGP